MPCSRPTITRLSRALISPSTVACCDGDADAFAHRGGLVDDVEPGDGGAALGRLAERGEDADRGGLAGAVVAEQAEDGAGRDVEVEVAQRPQVAEPLAQPGRGDATGCGRSVGLATSSARWLSYAVLMFRT